MEMIEKKGPLQIMRNSSHFIDENEHPMIYPAGGDEGWSAAADFIQTITKADIADNNMGRPVNKVVVKLVLYSRSSDLPLSAK